MRVQKGIEQYRGNNGVVTAENMQDLILGTTLNNSERKDVEDLIIGYLLCNPDCIIETSKLLKPSYFQTREIYVVYSALVKMAEAEMPIDLVQLEIYLERRGELEIVGGSMGIAMLAEGTVINDSPSKNSFDRACQYLIEIHKRIELVKSIAKLKSKLMDLACPFDDLTQLAATNLEQFLDNSRPDSSGLAVISESIDSTAQAIVQRTLDKRQGKSTVAIETGFADLDKHMGGWHRGDFVVLGARPGVGKSALAVQMCLKVAAQGLPVAFFSLEMTTSQMNTRCLSMVSGVSSELIRDGHLDDSQIEKIYAAAGKIAPLNYWGTDKFATSIDFVISECRKLAAKQGQLGVIAIDYIQLMILDQANSLNEVSNISRKLKSLAIELNCTIIGLSQLNRAVEGRNDKRPIKSDLRDSGTLEQDPDIILMLYRDAYYNPDTAEKNTAEVLIRKFRNGREGVVKLVYDGNTTSFKNYIGY
jgi:replicative DNA helicase